LVGQWDQAGPGGGVGECPTYPQVKADCATRLDGRAPSAVARDLPCRAK
jgi:hypothetical protein